jgi:hypothetical protein
MTVSKITKAVALCNNEVAFIAWDVDGMIPGCLGFDIVRIYVDTGETKGLAAWVPFKGQDNQGWKEQDTGVWPVQKTNWRDLTLRRRRDRAERRPENVHVKYRIRPVGRFVDGLERVPIRQPKNYTGDAIPLGYLGPAVETNEITVTSVFGGVQAAFNNGILAGQWLRRALEDQQKPFNADTLMAEVNNPASPIRQYLYGDVLSFLKRLIERAAQDGGKVHLALYELDDDELIDLLIANRARVEIILSNSSAGRESHAWDERNTPARERLNDAGVTVQNRLFNNRHIGHNKFAVYIDANNVPRAVMTGSTNWTSLGLCGQTNNSIMLEDDAIAAAYLRYWQALHDDEIADPRPPSAPGGSNVQGRDLRERNQHSETASVAASEVTVWYAPNTIAKTRNIKKVPPDLEELFALIDAAKSAIFFLAFGVASIASSSNAAAGRDKPRLARRGRHQRSDRDAGIHREKCG